MRLGASEVGDGRWEGGEVGGGQMGGRGQERRRGRGSDVPPPTTSARSPHCLLVGGAPTD